MRIPLDTPSLPPTTTTAINTDHSDHMALLAAIPQIEDPSPINSSTSTFPTTRDHPPFLLSIPKPLIDLYQLGDDNTRTFQQEALLALQQLHYSTQVTTDHIDKAAKLIVDAINNYHLLAKKYGQ